MYLKGIELYAACPKIEEAIKEAISLSTEMETNPRIGGKDLQPFGLDGRHPVTFEFNNVIITVNSTSDPSGIFAKYRAAFDADDKHVGP